MAIEWDPQTMATGHADVDEQHKEWLRRFNQFEAAVINGQGAEAVRGTLDFLVQYTDTHFTYEEALGRRLNDPGCDAHHRAHDVLRTRVAEIKAWVDGEGQATAFEVVALKTDLGDWLVKHIQSVDVRLREL